MAIGRTNIPIINTTTTDSGEYVRPIGAPDMDTIAANAPIINNGGINYYPIFAASAMDTFASATFAKTGTGISTGADAYVFSDEPSTLYVGTSVSHTFNTALDYTTDQSWKARYYIGYATEANKNATAGITINLYSYTATYEFVGTQYLKLSAGSDLFGRSSGGYAAVNLKYINISNSSIYNNTISSSYFCEYCIALQTIKLPSINSISGSGALSVCYALNSLDLHTVTNISGGLAQIGIKSIDLSNLTYCNDNNIFAGCHITTLNLPKLETTFGFNNTTSPFLINVYMPKLKQINGACFTSSSQNTRFNYFEIPNTITTITGLTADSFYYIKFFKLPNNFNISGCNFTGDGKKSITWFHHLATQLADRSSTTAGTIILGSANIALIPAADAATIAAKNWTLS